MSRLNKLPPRLSTLSTKVGSDIGTKRIRGYTLQKINDRIAARDKYICQICGKFTTDYEIDHVVPLFMGGREEDTNRQLLCREPCHRIKSENEEKYRKNY